MYAATLDPSPLGRRPACPATSAMSALERLYPRICNELVRHWFREDIDAYLAGLIMDERSDRQGFPFEVIDELMFLADLRWTMTHDRPTVQPGPVDSEEFSFVAPPVTAPAVQARRPWLRLLGLR